MSNQAHVSSEVLKVLMDGFQNCASSIASLRGAIRGHITECLNTAKDIVEKLRQIEHKAQVNYERCSDAYYACVNRQKYDEEKQEYRPSCNCEQRDMTRAENELYQARQAREQAEMRLNEMEREVNEYQDDHGGEGIMNSITDEYIPEATNRLMALSDKVQRYEALEITGIDIGDASSSTPKLSAPQSKTLAFGKGIGRLEEKMRQRKALLSGYCNKCHCCPCECNKMLEYLMSKSR